MQTRLQYVKVKMRCMFFKGRSPSSPARDRGTGRLSHWVSPGPEPAWHLPTSTAKPVNASFGPASILGNNAGVIRRTEIEGANYESDWDATFAVNVTGPRNMVRAFLPDLKTTSGCVVNLASIMSLVAGPGLTAYAASKGAVAQFTKALAQDMAPHGVRVNAILPGVIETPMTEVTRQTPEAIGRFMAHTPMRRVGQPEELVGPVVFLASKAASYVTGALLPVDGGYLTA